MGSKRKVIVLKLVTQWAIIEKIGTHTVRSWVVRNEYTARSLAMMWENQNKVLGR